MSDKINLVTVVGYQHVLIPHFINHYSNIVDDFYFIVHQTEEFNQIINELQKFDIKPAEIIHVEKYNWDAITGALNNLKRKLPDDWWVITDIDEFQVYPKPITEIIKECDKNGYQVVYGLMIDRIGKNGKFSEITQESIWKTFPIAGYIRSKLSKACNKKVSMVKGKIDVGVGQHVPKFNGEEFSHTQHPRIYPIDECLVQIHHFKWDFHIIERTKNLLEQHHNHMFFYEDFILYNSIKNGINLSDKNFYMSQTTDEYKSYKHFNTIKEKTFGKRGGKKTKTRFSLTETKSII